MYCFVLEGKLLTTSLPDGGLVFHHFSQSGDVCCRSICHSACPSANRALKSRQTPRKRAASASEVNISNLFRGVREEEEDNNGATSAVDTVASTPPPEHSADGGTTEPRILGEKCEREGEKEREETKKEADEEGEDNPGRRTRSTTKRVRQ